MTLVQPTTYIINKQNLGAMQNSKLKPNCTVHHIFTLIDVLMVFLIAVSWKWLIVVTIGNPETVTYAQSNYWAAQNFIPFQISKKWFEVCWKYMVLTKNIWPGHNMVAN